MSISGVTTGPSGIGTSLLVLLPHLRRFKILKIPDCPFVTLPGNDNVLDRPIDFPRL